MALNLYQLIPNPFIASNSKSLGISEYLNLISEAVFTVTFKKKAASFFGLSTTVPLPLSLAVTVRELGTTIWLTTRKMGSRKDGRLNNNSNDGQKTNRFLYKSTAQKNDPWRDQDDGDDFHITSQNKPINTKKRTTSSPGFDLDNVWSIRKNVQVSSSIKNGTALKTTGKSFYSRHGGIAGNSSNLSKKPRIDQDQQTPGQSTFESKSWRPGYSYSDRFSNNDNDGSSGGGGTNNADFDREFGDVIGMDDNRRKEQEEFESKMNKMNVRLPMPGAPRIATREMSARTKRAHMMHEAHLKSSGLGQFTSSSGPYNRQLDENEQVKWEKNDEFS
ncbi:hypothetical protein AC249_AIPGENE10194 [Exaiptasia diaphana]|nr:hypothetical protein AC249_AIPGENE10194 [Exaiptasia diaphana]